jgi:hypothetical protein
MVHTQRLTLCTREPTVRCRAFASLLFCASVLTQATNYAMRYGVPVVMLEQELNGTNNVPALVPVQSYMCLAFQATTL